jgi:hypothetical protein
MSQDESPQAESAGPLAGSDPRPAPLEQASRAAWLGPLIALALLVLTWKMPRGIGSVVVAIIDAGLLLAGLCLGIVALAKSKELEQAGAATTRRVRSQAIVGIALSLVIGITLLWTTFFTSRPAKSVASTTLPSTLPAAPGSAGTNDPILDYPGWLGSGAEARANLVLASISADSPAARDFKSKFSKDFTIFMLSVDTSKSAFDTYVDIAGASAHLTEGKSVTSLPIAEVLASATREKEQLLAEWSSPRRCAAGAGTVTNLFIPMPADIALTSIDRVTVHVNGMPVEVRGRFFTAQEKQQQLRRNGPPPAPSK